MMYKLYHHVACNMSNYNMSILMVVVNACELIILSVAVFLYVNDYGKICNQSYSKSCLQGTMQMRIWGHFLRTVSYLPHV